MDFDLKDIIGYKPPALSMAQARWLCLQDPRIVNRYLAALSQSTANHNLFQCLETLYTLTGNQWTQQNTQEYEGISKLFRKCVLAAEHKCHKIHTGNHPWSPSFIEATHRSKFYRELTVK